ncbi:hypothetical protein [Corynebacterium anserum]|uniref:Uncharacterized protein n=1 Tax=Corynebacterium anserum TaxID=2684406 RepID=A0A7G7YQ34_9CORY|nr:hypothetical protein [Corynebacterium anserum]QNH96604.1 hypothetical protein GP473_07950 [Corynebacterium anserum]
MNDFRSDPEYVARRRQIIRENHPDRGGSDEQLIRALKELDEQWSRRRSLRSQFEQSMPSFIPGHIAEQAYDRAEIYVGKLQKSTEHFFQRRNSGRASDLAGKIAEQAGRFAGSARRKIQDEVRKRTQRE